MSNMVPRVDIEKFFDELSILCKKYYLSISHEDCQGAFIIEDYKESNLECIKEAIVKIKDYSEWDF